MTYNITLTGEAVLEILNALETTNRKRLEANVREQYYAQQRAEFKRIADKALATKDGRPDEAGFLEKFFQGIIK